MNQKLFREMSPSEQSAFITEFNDYVVNVLPLVQHQADGWVAKMQQGLRLICVIPQSHSFVDQAFRYGDYGSRINRFVFYIQMIQEDIVNGNLKPAAPAPQPAPKRGRPASAATIARREAEAEAAKMQQQIFDEGETANEQRLAAPMGRAVMQPQVMADLQSASEYKLSIAQIKPFLSPELQQLTGKIRDLRIAAGAFSEKAKTMADMKASPDAIAPIAQQAQEAIETVDNIYRQIDEELGIVWYRLQNDEPFRTSWLHKYGFKSADDLHPDLKNDLRKHYQKMKSPEFDLRCRTVIEQSNPEYVAAQKAEADKKKEAQDIIRYLKRKDKAQKPDTAKNKFRRLEQLLGKKEAATYKPLLDKIIDNSKKQKA